MICCGCHRATPSREAAGCVQDQLSPRSSFLKFPTVCKRTCVAERQRSGMIQGYLAASLAYLHPTPSLHPLWCSPIIHPVPAVTELACLEFECGTPLAPRGVCRTRFASRGKDRALLGCRRRLRLSALGTLRAEISRFVFEPLRSPVYQ